MSKAKVDLSKRGQKALFKMKSMFKSRAINYNTSMHLFDHIIKPIILYGSDIWGITYIKEGTLDMEAIAKDDIEECHIRYCRTTLCVSKKAPTIGIYGETGRYPLVLEAVTNAVKFWCRLMKNDHSNPLMINTYNEMQSMYDIKNTLHGRIMQLINKHGINMKSHPHYIYQKLKITLRNQYSKYWKNKLFDDPKRNGNKLRSYRTYKDKFQKEEYLKLNSKSLRGTLARLRLSAHNLHIETGRYVKQSERKEPQDRLCVYCDLKECEDEYHFVMRCTLYQNLRQKLFDKVITHFPFVKNYSEKQQFTWLLASADITILKELASFVHNCFVRRRCSKQ